MLHSTVSQLSNNFRGSLYYKFRVNFQDNPTKKAKERTMQLSIVKTWAFAVTVSAISSLIAGNQTAFAADKTNIVHDAEF
jgi:hypothetical protein